MSRPWMPLYVADYLRDTRKLTAAEHGAYLLLIMEYWTTATLPDDDRQLARIASMSTSEWKRARPNIEGFFHDGWKHKRLDAELARSAEISSKRAASAKQRHSNSSANAQQVDTHAGATSQSQSQPPEQKERTRAVAPSDDWPTNYGDLFWEDYPRKTEKLAAMKKLASIRKSGIVTFAELMAGVRRYAALKTEPQFTKSPVTWLNAGCWTDETQAGGANGNGNSTVRTNSASQQSGSASVFAGVAAATERRARERSAAGQQRPLPVDPDPPPRDDADLFREDGRAAAHR